jgi:predicted patatin/cPLA2 family phospholipase
MRASYPVGVLNYLRAAYGLKSVDIGSGESAGIVNAAFFMSDLLVEENEIWTSYVPKKDFLGFKYYLTGKGYLNIGWLVEQLIGAGLTNQRAKSLKERIIVPLVDTQTGELTYFENSSSYDFMKDILKASMSMAGLCKPVSFGGHTYSDSPKKAIPLDHPDIKNSRKIIVLTQSYFELGKPRKIDIIFATALRKLNKITDAEYEAFLSKEQKSLELVDQLRSLDPVDNVIIEPSFPLKRFNNSASQMNLHISQGQQDAMNHHGLRKFLQDLLHSEYKSNYFQ